MSDSEKLEEALVILGFSKVNTNKSYSKYRDLRCNIQLFYYIDFQGNLLEGPDMAKSLMVNHRIPSMLKKAFK